MRLTSSIESSRARRSGLALVTRLCGVRSCTLSLLPPARASRLLDLQRQQALARAEDEEVRLPGLGSYGYVVPDQAVVRQQALELVQHQHPALAGVAAPVNLGQTLWKTAIFLPRCSVCGCVSGVQQVIALGAPRRLALRMRAESAAGLSNQKGYFKKAISARWTSAFSYEKMSNRCLGPMDALPRAHSSGQGLGWLEPEGGHARAKAVCLPLRPMLGLLQKRKCLPPASEAMRAVFAWAVLGLLRPCAAQWLWHVRAGAACGKWIHAPERLCTSCRRLAQSPGIASVFSIYLEGKDMATTAEVARNVSQRVHNDGFLGLGRNDNLKQTVRELKDLSKDERNAAIGQISDADLRALADDVNASGLCGASGLSADERRDLFNTLAQGLDGQQLGRMAQAFDSRQDVIAIGQAVAQHADAETKLAFIEEMAPRTANGDSHTQASLGAVSTETGDKEAEAILDVLNSLGGDAASFNQAIQKMDDKTLQAVVDAGLNKTTTTVIDPGAATTSVSYDPQQLEKLLEVAKDSADPAVKARVFAAASEGLDQVRTDTGFPVVSVGADKVAQSLQGKLTRLMQTDASGITGQLNAAKGINASTQEWLNQLNPWGNMRMYKHYTENSGKSMTLTEMGLSVDLKQLVNQDGAFGKEGSIQGRFIQQVIQGETRFKNAYKWGDEMVWAMGSGMLEGEFKGTVVKQDDGAYKITGHIEYHYTDRFEDPYDTFNWVPGSWDPYGTPYDVEERWTVPIDGVYSQ